MRTDVPVVLQPLGIVTHEHLLAHLKKAALSGDTVAEIAEGLLVTTSTLRKWMGEYEGVREAIAEGEQERLARIDRRMIDNAIEGSVEAGKWVLANRVPERWGRDKTPGPEKLPIEGRYLLLGLAELGKQAEARLDAKVIEGEKVESAAP